MLLLYRILKINNYKNWTRKQLVHVLGMIAYVYKSSATRKNIMDKDECLIWSNRSGATLSSHFIFWVVNYSKHVSSDIWYTICSKSNCVCVCKISKNWKCVGDSNQTKDICKRIRVQCVSVSLKRISSSPYVMNDRLAR